MGAHSKGGSLMATCRYVQCAFWSDPFILGLTPEEKYFYLYLITNPHTKQCGVYELPPKLIELETGYNTETVQKLFKNLLGFLEKKKKKQKKKRNNKHQYINKI